MSVSDDTYVADLLRLAGGVNVFGGAAERYPRAEPSGPESRRAEVHLFPSEPYPFREEKHGAMTQELFGDARPDVPRGGRPDVARGENARRARPGSPSPGSS